MTGTGPGTGASVHHPVQTSPPVVLGSLVEQLGADFASACAELTRARLHRRDRDSREHRAAGALSRTAAGPVEPTAPERLVSRRPVSAPDGHERRPGRTR